MQKYRLSMTLLALLASGTCLAAAPAGAPAGATALCKDGTYFTGPTKSGACSGHKGIKDWYGDASGGKDAKKEAKAEEKTEAKPAEKAAKGKEAAPAAAAPAAKPSAPAAAAPAQKSASPAAAAGPNMVWVNEPSKVYHCPNTRWYGKTKEGSYMGERDAVAKGYRPDHNKACGL